MKISLNEINWYYKRRCGFHWLGKWNENEERRFFFIIGKKLINGQDEDGCLHLFFDLNEENSRFQISNIRIVFWEIESWYCDCEGGNKRKKQKAIHIDKLSVMNLKVIDSEKKSIRSKEVGVLCTQLAVFVIAIVVIIIHAITMINFIDIFKCFIILLEGSNNRISKEKYIGSHLRIRHWTEILDFLLIFF